MKENLTRREQPPSDEPSPEEPRSQNASMLNSLMPGLATVDLAETGRTAETLGTVQWAFNPWHAIPNISLSGFGFGIQHVILERMCLIPLRTWKTPDIQVRSSGFSVGSITTGSAMAGAFPAGAVGSNVSQRLQYPAESAAKLLTAYGKDSPNNIGIVILDSLKAESDRDKLESIALFRAVMEFGERPGARVCLEDLPKFLNSEADRLLARACGVGVDIGMSGEERIIKLSKPARRKGEQMIEAIAASVAAATFRALDENSGILPKSKSDLIAASKGLRDVKVLKDRLDRWLESQFPSYSLDTDVERAARANASATDAIRSSSADNSMSVRELVDLQRQTLEQLARANEVNAEMARAFSANVGQQSAAPPPPGV